MTDTTGDGKSVSAEALLKLAALRKEIHDGIESVVKIGEGGWNHGAKQMRASGDAIQHLKYAEASLIEVADAARAGE